MLKIGMMHINAVNLGDLIIYKTSEYLLKKALTSEEDAKKKKKEQK